jgi:aminoglycoside phosphotransferase family enzyme/predicted kinase
MSSKTRAQDAVIQALENPGFYPYRPQAVEHVQTHISHVFLAGPYVYKLKKAVRFPFLDFSTPELRQRFCSEEVRLNRRLCPAVYLDVLPITRGADGQLQLGGKGEVIEHVVWMRRLPAERMLVHLLATGGVQNELIDALAVAIATFHAEAPTSPEIAAHADPGALRARWEEEARSTAPFAGRLLAAEDHEVLADFGPRFIRTHETLLHARQQAGRIREGHGDLHAEHVCFLAAPTPAGGDLPPLPAGIYVFDCIEFSEAFRCNDVASEIAFLAMDLDCLEHPELGRRLVATYVEAAADPMVAVLLPFYACYRAGVRGKVEGLKSGEPEVDAADREVATQRARQHFALATRYAWQVGGPAVIACCGLAGTGKTTLASELATTTGFLLVGSDAIRKRDVAAEPPSVAPYGAGLYGVAAREAVYEKICAEASAALIAGQGVIADATFIRAADRRRLAAVAENHRCPIIFVECTADETVVRARLEARMHAPSLSDARWETYQSQRERREPFTPGEPHVRIDTGGGLAAARAAAVRCLWPWRQNRWSPVHKEPPVGFW